MSFNLRQIRHAKENKQYIPDSKINQGQDFSDDHISRRLEKADHKDAPNQINEGQLEDYRIEAKVVTIEKRLDEVRSGEEDQLTEKLLNSSKSTLYKHRNEAAYKGDILKIEEKRLTQSYINEKEPYKPAAETPDGQKWWQTKSKDGLKLAKTNNVIKKAQYEPFYAHPEKGFSDVEQFFEEDERDPAGISPPSVLENEEALINNTPDQPATKDMSVIKFTTAKSPVPMVYMVLGFDPADFEGDRVAIEGAAIETVRKNMPLLADRLVSEDLKIDSSGAVGSVTIRLIGEDVEDIISDEEETLDIFKEKSFRRNTDADIPMFRGTLELTREVADMDDSEIVDLAVTHVQKIHPNLPVTRDAFDLSKLDQGIVRYVVTLPKEIEADSNFPIVTAEIKKN